MELGADKASVTWKPPANDGGAPITGYLLEYRKVGDSKWNAANKDKPVEELNMQVSGLIEGNEYEFRVAAINKAGTGPFSKPSAPQKYSEQNNIVLITQYSHYD